MGRLNFVLASRNENKLRELARVLGDWRLELLDASGYPPEEGATYYENALAKAQHGAKFAGEAWVLGEDSGLEVEGLAGAPGIRSARYAGEHASDEANNAKLLRALAGGSILFAGYLILGLLSPGSIGMGDVKLAAPLGLYLGYLGWQQVLFGGLLGFVVGGVLTVLMLRLRRAEKPTETAHGPAMIIAVLSVALVMN